MRSSSKFISFLFGTIFGLSILLFSGCGSGSGGTDGTDNTEHQSDSIPVTRSLNLKSMAFDNNNLGVFQSSNYYPGIRTTNGHQLYLQQFPTHNIVRVNAFDWAVVLSDACVPNSDYSNCITQFRNGLETSRTYLNQLVRFNTTKILMVDIFRTPTWLSSHPDATPACGGGKLGQSYRPKNYAVWQQLLQVTATFFKDFEIVPNGTQIYYQFWNEPDLDCNWQEGTNELLELYSQTMPYLKTAHPSAKVGGAGIEAWAGVVAKDRQTKTQNLNFDLIQYARANSLPLEFVSFHYFSTSYKDEFLDGIAQYRSFQRNLGILESQMPIILSEWLPQSESPSGFNPFLAADAGNLFLAMHEAKLWGQGGVPWQDYGPKPTDEWGLITNNPGGMGSNADATPKPIFYVYKFFDEISRASRGINYWTETIELDIPSSTLQPKFKIGERKFLFSMTASDRCYRFGSWNRLGSPEQASIAFLLGEGITVAELTSAYGADPATFMNNLVAAIKAGEPFAEKWRSAFQNANAVYFAVDDLGKNKEYGYRLTFSDFAVVASANGKSVGRDGVFIQDKPLTINSNEISFSLRPEEVLFSDICF
ncbi:MAG: hypothetical protein HY308_01010 [Gammaproteobacteria bacterium]|nr:hypothetical protein [Gammaproteobacteria bacterium]